MNLDLSDRLVGYLLLILLTGTTLLVLPYSVTDPINLPKMVFMVISSGACFGLLAPRLKELIGRKHISIVVLLLTFMSVLMSQLFTSTGPFSEALYGIPGRNTAVLSYMSFAIITFISVLLSDIFIIRRVIFLAAALGTLMGIYGVFQSLGKEPFPYVNVYESNVFGTFGNPNFQSAFLGIIGVLAFAKIIQFHGKLQKQLIYLGLLAFMLEGIYKTNSIQGFFNFGIGSGFFLLVYLLVKRKSKLAIFLGSFIFMGIVNVALAFFQIGPLSEIIYKGSMSARVYYWETAFRIWSHSPIAGVGLDQYGDWLRVYRNPEEVLRNITADSAHSVYLDVLSGGGMLLFIPFVLFTYLSLRAIGKVIRRKEQPPFEFLILIGIWVAYQAQSLISIGHLGIAVWGWLFTGIIIGYEIKTRDPKSVSQPQKILSGKKFKTENKLTVNPILSLGIGIACGCILVLPPYISATKYYNSFKTSDARVIVAATYLKPDNRNNFVQVAGLLKSNKFDKLAQEVATEGVQRFPHSFSLWRTLLDVTPVGSQKHLEALKKLHELDPNNLDFRIQ